MKKVLLKSIEGLTKDAINEYSIGNGAEYVSSDRVETYLVFITINKYLQILWALLK